MVSHSHFTPVRVMAGLLGQQGSRTSIRVMITMLVLRVAAAQSSGTYGFVVTSGPCTTSTASGADCVSSPNHPNNYANDQSCTISVPVGANVTTEAFHTEDCCDHLTREI